MRLHVMATSRIPPRALRIGVLLRETLVEERLFKIVRNQVAISIGQSARCDLSIPSSALPLEHTLFAVEHGQLVLRVTAAMTGRLAQEATIQTEAEFRAGPGRSGVWTVPIERGGRGKLHIGEATILFQEVVAPPSVPRPQLPASVRGTLADRIDPRLAVVIAGSLLVHTVIGAWAWMTEHVDDDAALEEAALYDPPRYDVIELSVPDIVEPPTPTPVDPTPGAAAPVSPRQTPSPIAPRVVVRPRPGVAMPEPDVDRWALAVTNGTTGPNGQGEIKNRSPGAALDKQIADIRDHNRDIHVGTNPTSRDAPPRIGTGPDGPNVADPVAIRNLPKKSEDPIVRIRPVPMPHTPDQPSLTIAMVIARIQGSYLGGLQRCYVKHGLEHDATMVAKVAVSFTVDDKGMATDNHANGANAEVDACIQTLMGGWRFPVPKDKDGDPTDVAFKVVLALQPNQ